MTIAKRSVIVKQVPAMISGKAERAFLSELKDALHVDHPHLVLDCSQVRVMDSAVLHLLLCCLEEAMKRNGDVKLAAIPAGAEAFLDRTGVSRLFEMFDTADAAVTGFFKPQKLVTLESPAPGGIALRPDVKKTGARWSIWQAQSVGGLEEN